MKIIQKIKEHKFNDKVAILASAIVAVIVFLGIYGPYSLDVTEDAWIFPSVAAFTTTPVVTVVRIATTKEATKLRYFIPLFRFKNVLRKFSLSHIILIR